MAASGILYIAFGGDVPRALITSIVQTALRAVGAMPGPTTYAQVRATSAPGYTFRPSRNQITTLVAQYGADWESKLERGEIIVTGVRNGYGLFVTSGPFANDKIAQVASWVSAPDGNSYVTEPMAATDPTGGPLTISAFKMAFSAPAITSSWISSVVSSINTQINRLPADAVPTENGSYFRLSIAARGQRLAGDHGIPPNPGAGGSGWVFPLVLLTAGAAWLKSRAV